MVDFDRIHEDKQVRLTVGATNVDTGNFEYFDSSRTRIGVEHIMASAALPPAFAPVRIGDKAYWDGGLVSNTPPEHILGEWPRQDTLALQVDLWSARGERPHNMMDVLERAKDRSEEHTSELQSLMRISYADFSLNTKTETKTRQI